MEDFILALMFFGFLFSTLRRYWVHSTLVIVTVTAIAVLSGGYWLYAASLTTALVVAWAAARSCSTIRHIQNS